jgi:hypothetical protein
MFSKFGSNRTAASQILEIWRGRTEHREHCPYVLGREEKVVKRIRMTKVGRGSTIKNSSQRPIVLIILYI